MSTPNRIDQYTPSLFGDQYGDRYVADEYPFPPKNNTASRREAPSELVRARTRAYGEIRRAVIDQGGGLALMLVEDQREPDLWSWQEGDVILLLRASSPEADQAELLRQIDAKRRPLAVWKRICERAEAGREVFAGVIGLAVVAMVERQEGGSSHAAG